MKMIRRFLRLFCTCGCAACHADNHCPRCTDAYERRGVRHHGH